MKTCIIHLSSNEENKRNNISSFNFNREYIYEIKSFNEETKFLSDNYEIKEKCIFYL